MAGDLIDDLAYASGDFRTVARPGACQVLPTRHAPGLSSSAADSFRFSTANSIVRQPTALARHRIEFGQARQPDLGSLGSRSADDSMRQTARQSFLFDSSTNSHSREWQQELFDGTYPTGRMRPSRWSSRTSVPNIRPSEPSDSVNSRITSVKVAGPLSRRFRKR